MDKIYQQEEFINYDYHMVNEQLIDDNEILENEECILENNVKG